MPTYDDPYLQPVWNDIRSMEQQVGQVYQRIQAQQKSDQAAREQQWRNYWIGQIGHLTQQDPQLDPVGLIQFAGQHGLRDMEKAYKLMTHDEQVKAAEQRGFERSRHPTPPSSQSHNTP